MAESQSSVEVGAPVGVGEEGKKAKEAKKRKVLGTKGKRCLIALAVIFALVIAACLLLMFLPCLPPNLPFPEYNATLPKPLVGKQLPKDWLSGATPVPAYYANSDEDEDSAVLLGPESLARRGEILYTGLLGGHLVLLSPTHGKIKVSNVTDFGEECEDISEGAKCGRPMGMRFHSDGFLYVTDAYLGLYKVNVETGEKTRLAKSHHYISGRRPSLPNDLDIAEDGTVYWSDASTNVKVEDVVLEFMSEPSGRLIRYDPVKEKSEAIIKSVQCANGVQLSPEEDFVLVAEGGKDRILRYYLKGPKKGTHDIFVDGLPGIPDKIRSSGRPDGGYLVWCIVSHGSAGNGGGGGFLPFLRKNRMIRTMLMRGLFLLEKIFQNANDRFGDSFTRKMVYALGNLAYLGPFLTSEGLVLELDAHGNITGSFYSGDGSVTMASEMHVLPGGRGGIKGLGNIYIGSPVNPYLLQVPIREGEMLEMAKAYARVNTLIDNSTLLTYYGNELEEKLNTTTHSPVLEENNEIPDNITSSIQGTANVATSVVSSADKNVTLNESDGDTFTFTMDEDESNLTNVEDFLRRTDYASSSEGDNSNQSSTESLLDSFFATATSENFNAVTEKLLEKISEDVSNETDWQSYVNWNQTSDDMPSIKSLSEDDSGNMVFEYPVFGTENGNKIQGTDINSLGSYNQSISESVEFISQDGKKYNASN